MRSTQFVKLKVIMFVKFKYFMNFILYELYNLRSTRVTAFLLKNEPTSLCMLQV